MFIHLTLLWGTTSLKNGLRYKFVGVDLNTLFSYTYMWIFNSACSRHGHIVVHLVVFVSYWFVLLLNVLLICDMKLKMNASMTVSNQVIKKSPSFHICGCVKVPAALTLAKVDRLGWVRWLTLNNRRQLISPKPDSRPRLEGAPYKYLTSCSRLLTLQSCTHSHTSLTRLLPSWASAMGLL